MKRKIVIFISNSIRLRKENSEYVILTSQNGRWKDRIWKKIYIYCFYETHFANMVTKIAQIDFDVIWKTIQKSTGEIFILWKIFLFKNPSRNLKLGGFETSSWIPFQKSIFPISNFKNVKKGFEFTHLLPNGILYSLFKIFHLSHLRMG